MVQWLWSRTQPGILSHSAGSNPRRDTSQMGTAMTCGNVEGMLVVNQELALPSHDEKA